MQYCFHCCNTLSIAFSVGDAQNIHFHNLQGSLIVFIINSHRRGLLLVVTTSVNYQMVKVLNNFI